MRKFFVIPLLALFSCVSVWGETITVGDGGTYPATSAGLQQAIIAAQAGDVIELKSDIAYPATPAVTDLINIDKSITLDGKNFAITGFGYCNYRLDDKAAYQPTSIAVNANHDKSGLSVTIKNLNLSRPASCLTINGTGSQAVAAYSSNSNRYFGVAAFDGVTDLTLEGCSVISNVSANSQLICVQGSSSTPLNLTINNSTIDAQIGYGYATYFLKPLNLVINNSTIRGYCALYFKSPLEYFISNNAPSDCWYGRNNSGTRGSVAVINNSVLDARNPSAGTTNDFGILALEEDGIDITLNNCDMNAEELSTAKQALYLISSWTPSERRTQEVKLTINGGNSHIKGEMVSSTWYHIVENGSEEGLYENGYSDVKGATGKRCDPFTAFTGDIKVIMTGGTYNFDPRYYTYDMHVSTEDPHYADGAAKPTVFTQQSITIPSAYTVETLEDGGKTLYRIIENIQTSYNINQDVPEEAGGAGENPNTNFIVQETTTLDNNATEANYVHVKDNGGVQTTLTVGKADADQTLTVTNGMDVQDNAQVIIKSGSALVVENGGIISAQPSNIVVEADENGAASLLLAPTVTVNQQPNVTVKMTAKQVGKVGSNYYWHRFALPVEKQETAWTKSPDRPTWLYGWDYENNQWAELDHVSDMKPFYGYTLAPEHEGREDVTYTFTGKLAGNTNGTLQFSRQGYNFFGNSYTGYMNIVALLDQLIGDTKIDAAVWMWQGQQYISVPLKDLQENPTHYDASEKEVAPMQTFILRLLTEELTSTEVNYEDAIWNNPRYGNVAASAPARRAQSDDTFMRISISAENGECDVVRFSENAKFSDSYDKGYDATKFMNDNMVNMYAAVNGEELSSVATNNLEGKTLTIATGAAVNYTLSFDIVNGAEYALRDNVTNQVIAIEAGATYEFAAQPKSTIENRFEIIARPNAPTAIENTEVKANVKGIYTITGQFVGENFDVLPAGVYVVNGVKIVK